MHVRHFRPVPNGRQRGVAVVLRRRHRGRVRRLSAMCLPAVDWRLAAADLEPASLALTWSKAVLRPRAE